MSANVTEAAIGGNSMNGSFLRFGRHHTMREAHFGVINPDANDPPETAAEN